MLSHATTMNDDNAQTAASAWLNALDAGFPAKTPTKPFICSYPGCNKTFTRASARQSHFKVAHIDVHHVCVECGKAFDSTSDLSRHEGRAHPGLESWQCSPLTNIRSGCACGRRFASREALHKHQRSFIASEPGSPTVAFDGHSKQPISGKTAVEDALSLGLEKPGDEPHEAHPDLDDAAALEYSKRHLMSSVDLESHTPRSYQPSAAAAHGSSIARFFVIDRPGATQSNVE